MDARLHWFGGPSRPLLLAPMAGFTDVVFRGLCKQQGADIMTTEFVMANKFLDPRGEEDAWSAVDFSDFQRPMGVQIFGGEADKMAEAADRIVDRLHPDFMDINYGCPAPRVVNNCAGSSLLKDPCRLGEVAATVVQRVSDRVPVTAKIRIGWDSCSINAVEIGRLLEESGIAAVTVHGRTKEQGYRGEANWDVIHAVADAVSIPVVGNGSIQTAGDVERIQAVGKVAGLMIGRAALGYPWIFREIKHALETGDTLPPPDLEERWDVIVKYCERLLCLSSKVEDGPWDRVNWMRPRLQAFCKNLPGARKLRNRFEQTSNLEELLCLRDWHLREFRHEAEIPV